MSFASLLCSQSVIMSVVSLLSFHLCDIHQSPRQKINAVTCVGLYRTNILCGIHKIDPMHVIGELNLPPGAFRENRMNAYLTLTNDVSDSFLAFVPNLARNPFVRPFVRPPVRISVRPSDRASLNVYTSYTILQGEHENVYSL